MTLRFTPPPEEAHSLPRYASYVVGSGLKVHSGLSGAKNSWRNRGWHSVETGELVERYGSMRPERKRVTKHAFILENVDGIWYTLYEIKPGLTETELPWYKDVWVHKDYGWKYYKEPHLPEHYIKKREPFPMSREEYVEFRLAVQMEQIRSGRPPADLTPAEGL